MKLSGSPGSMTKILSIHGEGDREAVEGGVQRSLVLHPPSVSPAVCHLPVNGEDLRNAADRLSTVSDTPRLDAELLLADAMGVDRMELLLVMQKMQGDGDGEMTSNAKALLAGFAMRIERRLAHEPMAYILGRRDFWTISLDVAPGVLIPRPDSETLIEAAVDHFGDAGPLRILDLGTGPGTLLLAALDQWPTATGLGIDASDDAIAIARVNVQRIAPGRAEIRKGSWAEGITEKFDLILCNPPYVEEDALLDRQVRNWEPAAALFGGADGLDCYRQIVPQLPALIAPGGMIALEIGHTQAEPVSALFRANGLSPQLRRDLAGRPRALIHFALGNRRETV
jgi:release factor glutamine methyltransferase